MTRHTRPGHVAFLTPRSGNVRPSQIRRTKKNAGNRFFCLFCGRPELTQDGVIIHQKVCEYRDPAKRGALERKRAWRRRREHIFDSLYDCGYMAIGWVRRVLVRCRVLHSVTVPVRGPEPTYPSRTQRLLDSVSVKYGRPCQ